MPGLNVRSQLTTSTGSTSLTSLQDTSTAIQYTDDGGTEVFVAYRANSGGNDASQVGEMVCLQTTGSVTLGIAAAESNGGSVNYSGGQLQGFARMAISGSSDSAKLQHRCQTSSDTNTIGSRGILSIPLNQPLKVDSFDGSTIQDAAPLTENADFFYSGTNSATAELTSIGNTWTTARTVDFSIVTAGNYFVFFSVETKMASGSTTDGHQARFQIGGTTLGAEWVREWENNADIVNFALSDIQNLTAGSHTFRIQVQNRNANSTLSAFRTRIWAFRAETFPLGVSASSSSGDSAITHTAYTDSEIFLDAPYTTSLPSVETVGFATVNLAAGAGRTGLAEIRSYNGSAGRCVDSGYGENDDGLDSGDDMMPTLLFHTSSDDPSDSAGFKVRTRVDASGTATIGRNAGNTAGIRNSLIVWPCFVQVHDVVSTSGEGLTTTTR